ncbi:MAG: DUF115 domain-containing protein, partial [Promethearchaeota archaeon]
WNVEDVLRCFNRKLEEKKIILIYGCGPSLVETVNKLQDKLNKRIFKISFNLAADGASMLLSEKGIPIDGIFTDLDGITKNEFHQTKFMIVHAHGDNLDKLDYFKDEIINFPNVIGTTQVKPDNDVLNPGGFTDGDRIIFFLRSLLRPYHVLFLIGMDFNKVIGRYSKPNMSKDEVGSPLKVKKLGYAVELIKWITERINNDIYFVNSEPLDGNLKYLSIQEFEELIGNKNNL